MGLEPPILASNGFSNPGLLEISCQEHPNASETQPSNHHEETMQLHQDVRLGLKSTHLKWFQIICRRGSGLLNVKMS